MSHPAADPLDLGITTRTAVAIAAITDPIDRWKAATRAHQDRRAELTLLAALLRERDGRGPTVAQLERADAVLADLTVLAIA